MTNLSQQPRLHVFTHCSLVLCGGSDGYHPKVRMCLISVVALNEVEKPDVQHNVGISKHQTLNKPQQPLFSQL